ncbi:hypothetical protein ACFQV2_40065 [Actinokineospora soli]|uniref:RsbT co-antagonist protein RsbRD N-terminal domain-containing protein n=1 Tax=Actinokineospora soli TaxID=1048753 RepID=A0ABW2TF60_9PSEU
MPIAIGGVPLAGLLSSRMPELSRQVISTLLAELGIYRTLPEEEIGGEITWVVEDNLRLVAAMLREHQVPDLSRLAASARRRAEEGCRWKPCSAPTTSARTSPGPR